MRYLGRRREGRRTWPATAGPSRRGSSTNAVSVTSSPSQTKAGAGKAAESEPQALTKPNRRCGRGGSIHQQTDEVACVVDRRRSRLRNVERIERITLNERTVKCGERLNLADVIKHDEATADGREHSHLAAMHLHPAGDGVQLLAAALEHIVLALVLELTPWRPARSATSCQTSPWTARASSPAARLARACVFFMRRSRGLAVCGAGAKASS